VLSNLEKAIEAFEKNDTELAREVVEGAKGLGWANPSAKAGLH
jgi:Na+/phosphate symporter